MPATTPADANADANTNADAGAAKQLALERELADAVLTPGKAHVIALALPRASAAALRRASTQSSSAGARATRSRAGSFAPPLQRVESVAVQARVRRGGHSLYVVDVFLQRRSERLRLSDAAYADAAAALPAQALADRLRAERESDYRVEHRFAAFVALRARLQALVRHDPRECADCLALARLAARRQYAALALRRVFLTERARRRLLERLVNDALELAARFSELLEEEEEVEEEEEEATAAAREASAARARSGGGRSAAEGCAARAQAVALVDAFLRKPMEASLGII